MRGPEGNSIHYMEFSRTLLNPFLLWDTGKIDAIIRGSAHQCPRKVGTFFPNQVYATDGESQTVYAYT